MDIVVAQAIGIVAMMFNIFSYQQKNAKRIIAFQLFGGLFFAINYLLLDAPIGMILNIIGFVRAILFLKKEKLHTDSIGWLLVFTAAYLGAYVLNFTVFGRESSLRNLLVECLPVIGMLGTHLAFRHNSPKTIRRFCIISSVSWLIFNIVEFAIGAILCEVFSLVSIVIAMVKFDKVEAKTK